MRLREAAELIGMLLRPKTKPAAAALNVQAVADEPAQNGKSKRRRKVTTKASVDYA